MTTATEKQIAYINSLLNGFVISPEGEGYLHRTLEAMKNASDPKVARVHELDALRWVCGQLGMMKDPTFEWTKQNLDELLTKRQNRLDIIRQKLAQGINQVTASSLIERLKANSIPSFKSN